MGRQLTLETLPDSVYRPIDMGLLMRKTVQRIYRSSIRTLLTMQLLNVLPKRVRLKNRTFTYHSPIFMKIWSSFSFFSSLLHPDSSKLQLD
jgi:hypothetical protein